MHNLSKKGTLVIATLLALGITSVAIAERICDRYPSNKHIISGQISYCGDWGSGCTECYDPDTGGGCQTSLDTCDPNNEIDIRH